MNNPKVSIIIVTWNSKRYIYDCLESIMTQDYDNFSVMVIDNGSDDGTVPFVRSNYPTVSVLQNFRNLGFAKANNQGILLAKTPYVLVMNPDVILTEAFLTQIVAFAEDHPRAGSFTGKILKLTSAAIDNHDQGGLREAVRSKVFDSTGLIMRKNRQAYDRGEGQLDEGQFERSEEVFGVTAACALYRQEALMDVNIKNEIFDNDFFAYKEDVDLAWRLKIYGWQAWYTPSATSYHYRGLPSGGKEIKKIVAHRKQVSRFLRTLSFRNQYLMMIKNDRLTDVVYVLPQVIGWQVKTLVYSLIFERWQFKSMLAVIKFLPKMLIKRRVIKAHQKISVSELRHWFK